MGCREGEKELMTFKASCNWRQCCLTRRKSSLTKEIVFPLKAAYLNPPVRVGEKHPHCLLYIGINIVANYSRKELDFLIKILVLIVFGTRLV
jgi:hypothetical protein